MSWPASNRAADSHVYCVPPQHHSEGERMTFGRSAGLRALAVVGIGAMGLTACGSSSKTTTPTTVASGSPATTAATGSGGSALKLGFFGALTGPNAQLGI